MDIDNFQSIIIVTRINGRLEIFDTDGNNISPESVIDFMNDVKAQQVKDASV